MSTISPNQSKSKQPSSTIKQPGGKKNNVSVFVRIRPGDINETQIFHKGPAITFNGGKQPQTFCYDKVFDSDCDQELLFDVFGNNVITETLKGRNSTIFAYGQTGSGKTYSMYGPPEMNDPFRDSNRGLIPRIFQQLFDHLSEDDINFTCQVSYVELYNNQILDLLAEQKETNKSLNLRENPIEGVYIDGAIRNKVTSSKEAIKYLAQGSSQRSCGSTDMNETSSRSHSIFSLELCTTHKPNEGVIITRKSKLNLIDLAGSERESDTNAVGKRLREAGKINSSLSTLGRVIKALVDNQRGQKVYVPFRDSKLTFLLRESFLSGKTWILANISPELSCSSETLSTLQFVSRAKKIQNIAKVNENTQGSMLQLQTELKQLRQQLRDAQSMLQMYTKNQDSSTNFSSPMGPPGVSPMNNTPLLSIPLNGTSTHQEMSNDELFSELSNAPDSLQRCSDLRSLEISGKDHPSLLSNDMNELKATILSLESILLNSLKMAKISSDEVEILKTHETKITDLMKKKDQLFSSVKKLLKERDTRIKSLSHKVAINLDDDASEQVQLLQQEMNTQKAFLSSEMHPKITTLEQKLAKSQKQSKILEKRISYTMEFPNENLISINAQIRSELYAQIKEKHRLMVQTRDAQSESSQSRIEAKNAKSELEAALRAMKKANSTSQDALSAQKSMYHALLLDRIHRMDTFLTEGTGTESPTKKMVRAVPLDINDIIDSGVVSPKSKSSPNSTNPMQRNSENPFIGNNGKTPSPGLFSKAGFLDQSSTLPAGTKSFAAAGSMKSGFDSFWSDEDDDDFSLKLGKNSPPQAQKQQKVSLGFNDIVPQIPQNGKTALISEDETIQQPLTGLTSSSYGHSQSTNVQKGYTDDEIFSLYRSITQWMGEHMKSLREIDDNDTENISELIDEANKASFYHSEYLKLKTFLGLMNSITKELKDLLVVKQNETKTMSNQIQSLEENNSSLISSRNKYIKDISELEKKITSITKELQTKNVTLEDSIQNSADLAAQVDTLTQQITTQEAVQRAIQEERDALSLQNISLKGSNNELKNCLQEKESNFNDYKHASENSKLKLERTISQVTLEKEQLFLQIVSEKADFAAEKNSLEKSVASEQAAVATLKQTLEGLASKNDLLEQDLASEQSTFAAFKTVAQETQTTLVAEKNSLEKSVASEQAAVATLKQTLEGLASKNDLLEQDLASEQSTFAAFKTVAQETQTTLVNKNDLLEKSLASEQAAFEIFKKSAKESKQGLVSKIDSLEKSLASEQTAFAAFKQTVEEDTIAEKTKEIETNEKISLLEAEKMGLETQILVVKESFTTLQKNSQEKVSSLLVNISELKQELQDANSTNNDTHVNIEKLSSEIEALKALNEELKNNAAQQIASLDSSMKTKVMALEQERESLLKQVESQKSENSSILNKLVDEQNTLLAFKKASANIEESLTVKITSLDVSMTEMKKNYDGKLLSHTEKYNQEIAKNQQLNAQVDSQIAENDEIKNLLEKSKSLNTISNERIESFKSKISIMKEDNIALVEQISAKTAQVESISNTASHLEKKIQILVKSNESSKLKLRNAILNTSTGMSTLGQNIDSKSNDVIGKMSSLETKIKRLSSLFTQNENSISDQKSKMEGLERENKRIHDSGQAILVKYNKLKRKTMELQSKHAVEVKNMRSNFIGKTTEIVKNTNAKAKVAIQKERLATKDVLGFLKSTSETKNNIVMESLNSHHKTLSKLSDTVKDTHIKVANLDQTQNSQLILSTFKELKSVENVAYPLFTISSLDHIDKIVSNLANENAQIDKIFVNLSSLTTQTKIVKSSYDSSRVFQDRLVDAESTISSLQHTLSDEIEKNHALTGHQNQKQKIQKYQEMRQTLRRIKLENQTLRNTLANITGKSPNDVVLTYVNGVISGSGSSGSTIDEAIMASPKQHHKSRKSVRKSKSRITPADTKMIDMSSPIRTSGIDIGRPGSALKFAGVTSTYDCPGSPLDRINTLHAGPGLTLPDLNNVKPTYRHRKRHSRAKNLKIESETVQQEPKLSKKLNQHDLKVKEPIPIKDSSQNVDMTVFEPISILRSSKKNRKPESPLNLQEMEFQNPLSILDSPVPDTDNNPFGFLEKQPAFPIFQEDIISKSNSQEENLISNPHSEELPQVTMVVESEPTLSTSTSLPEEKEMTDTATGIEIEIPAPSVLKQDTLPISIDPSPPSPSESPVVEIPSSTNESDSEFQDACQVLDDFDEEPQVIQIQKPLAVKPKTKAKKGKGKGKSKSSKSKSLKSEPEQEESQEQEQKPPPKLAKSRSKRRSRIDKLLDSMPAALGDTSNITTRQSRRSRKSRK